MPSDFFKDRRDLLTGRMVRTRAGIQRLSKANASTRCGSISLDVLESMKIYELRYTFHDHLEKEALLFRDVNNRTSDVFRHPSISFFDQLLCRLRLNSVRQQWT
jgi:hypothetical protein